MKAFEVPKGMLKQEYFNDFSDFAFLEARFLLEFPEVKEFAKRQLNLSEVWVANRTGLDRQTYVAILEELKQVNAENLVYFLPENTSFGDFGDFETSEPLDIQFVRRACIVPYAQPERFINFSRKASEYCDILAIPVPDETYGTPKEREEHRKQLVELLKLLQKLKHTCKSHIHILDCLLPGYIAKADSVSTSHPTISAIEGKLYDIDGKTEVEGNFFNLFDQEYQQMCYNAIMKNIVEFYNL